MQAHPNTNRNLLARTKYVNDHYPPAKNPLLYGAPRTERYINIMRNCTLARMDVLGGECPDGGAGPSYSSGIRRIAVKRA